MTILALLSLPLSILGWTALATVLLAGLAGFANTGPHGFSPSPLTRREYERSP
jgi:potassium-transporting ATPase potassium-binding subunit